LAVANMLMACHH